MASQAEPTRGLLGNSTLRAVCTASRSCYLIIPTELHTLKLSLECKGHGGEDVSSTAALNSKTRYKALLQKSLFENYSELPPRSSPPCTPTLTLKVPACVQGVPAGPPGLQQSYPTFPKCCFSIFKKLVKPKDLLFISASEFFLPLELMKYPDSVRTTVSLGT